MSTAARTEGDAHVRGPEAVGPPRERAQSMAWAIVQATMFAWSFHNWYRFRNALLRRFGATIEPTVRIRRSCRIQFPRMLSMARKSALGDHVHIWGDAPVSIGERAVVSQFSVIETMTCERRHDAGIAKPVTIGSDAWIAAESVVMPGSHVPDGVVAGSRSTIDTARAPLSQWTIAVGTPARSIKPRPHPLSAASARGNA